MFWRFRYTKKTALAWEVASAPPTSPSRSPTRCEGCAGRDRSLDAGPTPQAKAVRNHSAALLARPYPRRAPPDERKPARRAHTRLRGRSGRPERRPERHTFPWPAGVGQRPASPACPAPPRPRRRGRPEPPGPGGTGAGHPGPAPSPGG